MYPGAPVSELEIIAVSNRPTFSRVATAWAAATLALAAWAVSAQTPLPVTELSAGIHTIRAEVAATEEQRRVGLMHRESMKQNEGMLFVFDKPDQQCFWMRNTLIPLSIAFIADDGTIGNIADMAPQTTDTHCSKGAVRYALEMNRGWFAERGVGTGTKIHGLP